MNPVVYIIKNIINEKVYIGSSITPVKRFNVHKFELRNNKHGNKHLQRAWNKYGESNFIFGIVEYINFIKNIEGMKKLLEEREQYYADQYPKSRKYNIRPIVKSNLGIKHSKKTRKKMSKALKGRTFSYEHLKKLSEVKIGMKHTEETREKISKNHVDFTGERNPFYNKKHTKETREKIGKASKGRKFTTEVLQKMREDALGNNRASKRSIKT